MQALVAALPEDLQAVGADAEAKLETRFDQLSSDVGAKQEQLVDAIAHRYVETRDALDARIDELKAANAGVVGAALDFIAGVVRTISSLKDMLLGVLAKAADVIGDIISNPIGFLGNLVDGVMGGLNRFVKRIGVHLENAFTSWLFGALTSAGITLPARLDFAGILDLVLQVLGLTYQSIRARVALAVGEPVVARMEQAVDIFKTLATTGIAGLWSWLKDRLADLEGMVLGRIKEWVVERVIKGGIAWIIGLLNPAAAFIKACKAIYDIVMFVVERGSQIMEFVNSVLDSVGAIARGNISVAVDKVESALANALPLAISFLASLLGLGGISEKIKSIIAAVRKPIERAIDAVIMGTARAFKRTFGPAAGWVKGKVDAGKRWAQGKVESGKDWAKSKLATPGQAAQQEPVDADLRHDAAIGDGLAAIDQAEAPYVVHGQISREDAVRVAATVKREHPVFSRLEVVEGEHDWDYLWRGSGGSVHRTRSTALPADPGVSAPGLGRIGSHGSKPSSQRNGPAIHWLESEHVIPFATGKRLWQMVDLVVPGRGGHEDRGQTTIMIYYGAARIKTPADNELSEAFEAAVGRAGFQTTLTRARRAFDAGDRGALKGASDVLAQLMQGLRVAKDDAVGRTNTAIAQENQQRTEGSTRTNGERRGPPGAAELPLPTAGAVSSAAESQYDNIVGLVEREVSAVNVSVGR